jgi:hypothetical protein
MVKTKFMTMYRGRDIFNFISLVPRGGIIRTNFASCILPVSCLLPFGVPQGSVCGPILFILYYSPLYDIAATHGISDHGYADDEQLYISFRPSTDGVLQGCAFSSMSSCIAKSRSWATENKLKLSNCKIDDLLISSSSF